MCPLSSKKPSQKRIMGRWKWRQAKGTCWLPRWNAHRRQPAAISIRFNGVFSPIYNWKCVYCFIFPSWAGAANLIDHTENHLILLITHWLTLFLDQGWGNWNSPVNPKLCEQSPHPLVPMGLASCCPVVPDDSQWLRMWPRASAHGHWNGVRSSPRNTPSWCFPFKRHIMSCFSIQHCSDVELHCPHTANGGMEIKEECHLECESATSKERAESWKQQEVC